MAYRVYRQVDTEWIKVAEIPAPQTTLPYNCMPTEDAYCVRAVNGSGTESVTCSNVVLYRKTACYAWDENGACTEWRTIGRFMEFDVLGLKGGDCGISAE